VNDYFEALADVHPLLPQPAVAGAANDEDSAEIAEPAAQAA
jgi:hypothetical protein